MTTRKKSDNKVDDYNQIYNQMFDFQRQWLEIAMDRKIQQAFNQRTKKIIRNLTYFILFMTLVVGSFVIGFLPISLFSKFFLMLFNMAGSYLIVLMMRIWEIEYDN